MPPKSASKAVSTTAAAESTINGKRDAENVVQNTEVDNKKQKIVNGDVAHDFEKKLLEEKEEVKEVDSESEDSDSEDATPATWAATPNNNDAGDDDDDEDDSSEEDDEADNNATDAEMVDTPAANKESHNLTSGSTTLFMGNLSFSIKESQVVDFFKDAGEVVELRLAMRDGQFTGYGHVEFATPEAAQEALKLNGELLLQRAVRLELARESDRSSQKSGQSSQKSGTSETLTVFVKGFGTDDDVDDIKYCLKQHFGECGEISRVAVPKDFESGAPKGVAFIDFTDSVSFGKALQLTGSEVNGGTIVVDVAKQSGGDGGSGRGRGRGGGRGRFGGRDGGGGRGRFGGRDGGGRGRFGGRDGGRGGGRGRGRSRGIGRDRGRGRGRH